MALRSWLELPDPQLPSPESELPGHLGRMGALGVLQAGSGLQWKGMALGVLAVGGSRLLSDLERGIGGCLSQRKLVLLVD